jgi:non-heme chloroperoxidase
MAAGDHGRLADPVPADFVRSFQAGAAHAPLPKAFLEGLVAGSRKLPARVAGRRRWPGRLRRRGGPGADRGADAAGVGRPRRAVGAQEQARLVAAIPGARSRVYPETGHSPHWERPERFTADLDAFMRAG